MVPRSGLTDELRDALADVRGHESSRRWCESLLAIVLLYVNPV
jgi:hypothetical protein